MAIGTGTDVTIETADVILSKDSLRGIVRVIGIRRTTMRAIRQSHFRTFGYKALSIPVAAEVLYPFECLPMMLRQLHPILAPWPRPSATFRGSRTASDCIVPVSQRVPLVSLKR